MVKKQPALKFGLNLQNFDEPFNMDNSIVMSSMAYDIGIPVIKWWQDEGFDGYDKSVSKIISEQSRITGRSSTKTIKGKRYGQRKNGLESISQILIHHTGGDGNGAGRVFNTLHNERGLSVHFVIDDNGDVFQFLDCEEKAWHGGKHNDISVGIECNLYPLANENPEYYNELRCAKFGNLPHTTGRETIHGKEYKFFQFTDPQTESLARVCAGIWAATKDTTQGEFIEGENNKRYELLDKAPRFPRDRHHHIPKTTIARPKEHIGLIGHLQCTKRKIDPAGFPWNYFEIRVAEIFKSYAANLSKGGADDRYLA